MKKTGLALSVLFSAVTAHAATVYTGDKIEGVPVISKLDVSDLASGQKHRFFFQGATDGIGQVQYVPVTVAKGTKEGKRLVLNSGNHGDEITGVRAVQVAMASIDVAKLSGAVIGITGSNPNGLSHISRNWQMSLDGLDTTNLNRLFPGKIDGNAAELHAYLMFNNLLKGNVDYALDVHTQSTGTVYPFYVFSDSRDPAIHRLAELMPADQIKLDPGEKGTFPFSLIAIGVPATTIEIGGPRAIDPEMVARANEGFRNVMVDLKMIEGSLGRTSKTMKAFVGNDVKSVRALQGGYSEILVKIGDMVKKDQKIAVQLNRFGDVVREYFAPVDGKVLSLGTDAVREPRGLLVRIHFHNPDPKCEKGC